MKNLLNYIKNKIYKINIKVWYLSVNSVLLQKNPIPKAVEQFYDLFFFITDILLFISLILILMYNIYFKNYYKKNNLLITLTNINIYIYLFISLFIINLTSYVYVHYTLNFIHSNYTFILRLFIIILFLIFFILLKYYSTLSKNIKQFEFHFLIGCSALSLLLLLKSTNFISFIILLEIYSLISYILLIHNTSSLFSTEGGLKYFIIGSLSTGIAILGLFCLYTGTASYNYSQISSLTDSYSPFWHPDNTLPEYFETKAKKNPFLFELCRILNDIAHINYHNALEALEYWEPILSESQKKILAWNKEIQECIWRRPDKILNWYFPGHNIKRLPYNKNYISNHVQKAIIDGIISKQDVITFRKDKEFLKLVNIVFGEDSEDWACARLGELTWLRNNKYLLYLIVKNFLYISWEDWDDLNEVWKENLPQLSSLDLEQNPELFYKQIDLLKQGKIKEFKINQEACENRWLIEWQNRWHTKLKSPWQAIDINKWRHSNELLQAIDDILRNDYERIFDAYQRYRFNIEQSGIIGQEKQWLTEMINNYIAYVKTIEPSISDYNLQIKINDALKNKELVKFHPNYTIDDKFLKKHYIVIQDKEDKVVMNKHTIDKSLLEQYSKSLLQVKINREYVIIIENALNYQMWGLTFIFISLWLKLAIAPFHMWSFDAYEGTDTWVMSFLNIIPKCVILFFLIILINYFNLNYFLEASIIVFWCVIFSSLIGSIGGLFQYSFKRMLIYSGLSNSAFLMSFFIISNSENEHAFVMYILIYLSVMISIFLCLFWLRDRCTRFLIKNLYNLSNLILTHKYFVYYFNIFFFCLIGLPPLVFFLGKFYLLYSLFHYQVYIVVIILLFLTCLNITYYLRFIKIISLMRNENCFFLFDFSRRDSIILSLALLIIITIMFIPTPIFTTLLKIIFKY